MSFLKFDFTRSSPSPSKKGRSALDVNSLIKQTEQDLKSSQIHFFHFKGFL